MAARIEKRQSMAARMLAPPLSLPLLLAAIAFHVSLTSGDTGRCPILNRDDYRTLDLERTYDKGGCECNFINFSVPSGCVCKVYCKDNFYYANQGLAEGQRLTCYNGVYKNQLSTAFVQECLPGCPVLTDVQMKNATYISKPEGTVCNDKTMLYPEDTIVRTKCKENFVFIKPKSRESGEDEHRCMGGMEGWYDTKEGIGGFGRAPGLCDPLCQPIDPRDIPNGVNLTLDATTKIEANGKTMIKVGGVYKFRCSDGGLYPNGKKEQSLMCKGGDLGYQELGAVSEFKATVKPCPPKGCTKIFPGNVDSNAVITDNGKCTTSGDVFPAGCSVTIKCKQPTNYFPNPEFSDGHLLKCADNGKWQDAKGNDVDLPAGRYPEKCLSGCPVLSNEEMANATYVGATPSGSNDVFNNENQQIYRGSIIVATQCKPGFTRPTVEDRKNDPNSYECVPGEGWKNLKTNVNGQQPGRCDPACQPPAAPPTGTKYSPITDDRKFQSDGQTYVLIKTVIDVSCDEGFELPPNSPEYINGKQNLICKGGSLGWYDSKSGNNQAAPMTCTKSGAKGCEVVDKPNTNVTKNGCDLVDGLMTEKCKVEIRCQKGFYPSDPSAVNGDSQSLECEAGLKGWKDSKSGKTNVKPITCVPGCEEVASMEKAEYVGTPPSGDQLINYNGHNFVKEATIVSIKCKNGFVPKNENERDPGTIRYECKGGSEQWYKPDTGETRRLPGDSCVGTCAPLPDPLAGTVRVTNPAVFLINGQAVVAAGGRYRYKCITGFKYPDGTPEAAENMQDLVCKGDGEGYVNEKSNQSKAVISECKRGTQPGCSKLDTNNPPPGLNVTKAEGCAVNNDKTSAGCKLSLECADGYYPTTASTTTSPKQNIVCKDDGTTSKWVDVDTNTDINVLECTPGCVDKGVGKNAALVSAVQPSVSVGSSKYFTPGNTVRVKCNEGTVHLIGDTDDASAVMEYECRGGSSKPWNNKLHPGFETVPGEQCVKVCQELKLEEGGRAAQGPATYLFGSNVIVKAFEKYKLICIEGYRFPAGSPYSGNNSQILECDNDSGKYIDNTNGNKITDAPEKCIREPGPGCIDIKPTNGKLTSDSCKDSTKNGASCKITFECDPGFVPSDEKYHKDGKQELVCKDGNGWIDQFGNKIDKALDCKAVCTINKKDVHNGAKVTKNSTNTVTVNNIVYVENGAVVTVKCEGDGVLWELDTKETPEEHNFTCIGGKQGWKREDDEKTVVEIGDGCVRTCSPLSASLPDTVRFGKTPKVLEYEGKSFVAENSIYSFKCISDKYEYPKGSPQGDSQQESAKCNGETRKYVDADTGAGFEKPDECSRKTGLNECKKIEQDSSKTMTGTTSGCTADGDYYSTGCKITVKCKPGTYPEDKAYLIPSGEQQLVCGSGGSGWVDQSGTKITTGIKCIDGCIKLTTSVSTNRTITKQDFIYMHSNMIDKAVCSQTNETTTTTVEEKPEDHPYYCPKDNSTKNDKYYDDSCTNACRELSRPLPTGVTIFKNPEMLGGGSMPYAFGREYYVLKCGAGFVYPAGSAQRKNGRQTLVCNGVSHKYDDQDSGQKSVEPLACEPAKGCAVLPQPGEATSSAGNGCFFNDPYYNDGCSLTINCKAGFYPADDAHLYGGGQNLQCSEDTESWKDPKGEVVTKGIQCVSGCKPINPKAIIELFNSTTKTVTTTVYPGPDAETFYTCPDVATTSNVTTIIKKIIKEKNPYFCKISDETVINVELNIGFSNNMCNNACGKKAPVLPTGVMIKQEPFVFKHNDIEYVGAPTGFTLACKEGYEYPLRSPHTAKGEQKIACTGNGSYYDVETREIDPLVAPCEKIIGCSLPAAGEGVGTTKDSSTCKQSGNTLLPGCKYTLECEEGFYPVDERYQQSPNQTVVCIKGVISATWKDVTANIEVNLLQCAKGCIPKPAVSSNKSIITQIEITRLKIGTITVECTKRSVNQSVTVDSGVAEQKYYCKSNQSDSEYSNFTNTPCTNTCKELVIANTLTIKKKAPTAFLPNYPHLVVDKQTYIVACAIEGYVFSETKTSVRELQCDGSTKTYTDLATKKTGFIQVEDTCVAPKKKCNNTVPKGTNASIEISCLGQLITGCIVTVSCNEDFEPAKPGPIKFECLENGQMKEVSSGKPFDFIPSELYCIPKTTTATTPTPSTTAAATTTPTTTTPATTTPTTTTASTPTPGCPPPPSCPGLSIVDNTAHTAAGLIPAGASIELSCGVGYYPYPDTFLVPKTQKLVCQADGSYTDQNGPNAKPLTCIAGCIKAVYTYDNESTTQSTDSFKLTLPDNRTLACNATSFSYSANRKLQGANHTYYCDEGGSDDMKYSNSSFSPCNDACLLPIAGDRFVSKDLKFTTSLSSYRVEYKFLKKYTPLMDGETAAASCANEGSTFSFVDPPASTLNMVCKGSTGQWIEKSSGKVIFPGAGKEFPPCSSQKQLMELTKLKQAPGCESLNNPNGSVTLQRQGCSGSALTALKEQPGCLYFYSCGEKAESTVIWQCQQDGRWFNVEAKKSAATPDLPSCSQ